MRTRIEYENIVASSAMANGVTLSTSGVGEWKLWRDVVITVAMLLERIMVVFQKDVDIKMASKQHGSLYWYGDVAKQWQSGDNLVVNNGIVEYVPLDVTHRLVTQVSVKELFDDVLVMKVAKTVSNNLVALSGTELVAFQNYIKARKLPGTKINVYSLGACDLYVDAEIFFDTLYDSTLVLVNITAALELFKTNFSFDGVVYRSGIVDTIMSAQGVIGIGTLGIEITTPTGLVILDNYFELPSGYFNISIPTIALTPAI
jgi:hypothetical protein